MARKSKAVETAPVSFRLPITGIRIIERRMAKHPDRWKNVHDYLKDRVIYELTRKR